MEDLIDIDGLDAIGYLPLAIGWWLVIAAILISCICLVFVIRRLYKYRRSWRYQAYKDLEDIRSSNVNLKQMIQDLSVQIRIIAMQSTKRESCAGITGSKWLEWLEENDPKKFPWTTEGKVLIDAPYKPQDSIEATQIDKLIAAVMEWVNK